MSPSLDVEGLGDVGAGVEGGDLLRLRHAHANSAEVDIAVTADAITACVTDDGVGMAAAPRDGGLADLRRPATWHGGTLTVGPGALSGTRLIWTAPHHVTSPGLRR